MAYGPQLDALKRGDEVIVATPGRLIDLQNRGSARLTGVRLLILDEADRMLDMGFRPQIEQVVRGLGARPQTLLFSATMPNAVHDLALRMTRDAQWVEASPSGSRVQEIAEVAYSVRPDRKPDLLAHLLQEPGWDQVLVFTRTKVGADALQTRLARAGVSCDAIHGNRQMRHRTRAIERFTRGDVRVLVATDIAQRGLDIEGISHVVNYDVPLDPGDYVHRVGRTGRAGATGEAVTFVTSSDLGAFRTLEHQLERTRGEDPPSRIRLFRGRDHRAPRGEEEAAAHPLGPAHRQQGGTTPGPGGAGGAAEPQLVGAAGPAPRPRSPSPGTSQAAGPRNPSPPGAPT